MKLLFLRIVKSGALVGIRQFPTSPVLIGSTPESQLRLEGQGVGPVHAMIELRDDQFFVTDLGTEKGTYKNGHKIVEESLVSGDVLGVGEFVVEVAIGVPTFKSDATRATNVAPSPVAPTPPAPTRSAPQPEPPIVPRAAPSFPEAPKAPPPRSEAVHREVTSSGGTMILPSPVKPSKHGATFSPGDQIGDLKNHLQPGRGNVVEFVVAWGNRILEIYHADKAGPVTIGSHPDNSIVLPVLGGAHLKHTIANIGSELQVFFTDAMGGEVYQNGRQTPFRDLIAARQLANTGNGYWISLKQGEMVRVEFGGGVSVYVRFSEETIQPLPGPLLDFSPGELMALLLVTVLVGVVALYTMVTDPMKKAEEPPPPEPERKAVFVFKRQETPPPVQLPTPEPTPVPTPTKRQQVKVDVTKTATPVPRESGKKTAPTQAKKGGSQEGAASDAPKFDSPSQEKKLTTSKAGDDKGMKRGGKSSTTPNATGGSKGPTDVTKVGILSAFGKKGLQQQLEKVNAGSGNVSELGQTAGGRAGEAAGAGLEEGRGTKDLGASGQGTSTFGISGVKTAGRGGGRSGYGAGALGDKKGASIVPGGEGEAYEGTIDREAIRRVILANLKQLRACYEKALNQDPNLYGRVVIEFSIVDRGRVNIARTKTSTLGSRVAEDCMVARLRTWTFPEPPAGQEPLVQYPFVFSSQ